MLNTKSVLDNISDGDVKPIYSMMPDVLARGKHMNYSIQGTISKFRSLAKQGFDGHHVRELIEDGFLITPHSCEKADSRKEIGLTIMGITHGNEWAGSAILVSILEYIQSGLIKLPIPVAFILGNPKAALENKRFLERDLNRSFDRDQHELLEDKRARELEGVLQSTELLVDFHQTMLSCDRSFFIFPYSQSAFEFARDVNPRQTIVTHWGKPFSSDGRCTDEYVNLHGGVGISLETGQNGFELSQVAKGVEATLSAIRVAGERRGTIKKHERLVEGKGEVMTFSEILLWPEKGVVKLNEGLTNFRFIKAGEEIGCVDGEKIAPTKGGYIIFPKYLTVEQQSKLTVRPGELARFMEVIAETKLPV